MFTNGIQKWYKNGKLHRDNDVACGSYSVGDICFPKGRVDKNLLTKFKSS